MAGWRDLAAEAPREATFAATVLGGTATVGYVWVGDPDAGLEPLDGLRALGTPVAERVVPMSYLDLQRREDSIEGHALRRYWKGHYFRDLPDAAIEALLAHPPEFAASLQAYGGAIADVARRGGRLQPSPDGVRVRRRGQVDRPGRGRAADR